MDIELLSVWGLEFCFVLQMLLGPFNWWADHKQEGIITFYENSRDFFLKKNKIIILVEGLRYVIATEIISSGVVQSFVEVKFSLRTLQTTFSRRKNPICRSSW